jgi:hypothetical protein
MVNWLSQQLDLELRPRRTPLGDRHLDIEATTPVDRGWRHEG